MANHVRKQLRDAVVTAVTGLATTGTHVHGWRVYALQEADELPALSVYVTDEEASRITIHAPAVVERRVTVHVQGVAKASSSVEDTLDTIAKEVEVALASGVVIGSTTVPLEYTGCEVDIARGDKPIGMVDLRFSAVIHNTATAPDVLT